VVFVVGSQRLKLRDRSSTLIMRFSAGLEKPGLKPISENELLFRNAEALLPPAEAGGSHQARDVLADPFGIVAGDHVDEADEIHRVFPVDDEKGCGLTVEE
jgi:hypothetical protein